ncbi:two-component response regulator ARR14-like [Benincasa hispida]|uniref:two-component response regulator ARR14-like n=1 Tax=Benincasa hispida TaxID=102211 RepID=UPI001900101B|nr:two-component response regulator ARR14-like [Benincasa hispida]
MLGLNISNNLYHRFSFHVLLVDDDCTHLSAVENVLTSFGYQVVKFQTPEYALATLKRQKFDIVVCGISTSKIGAFNLVRTAQEQFNIPVILMVSNISNKVAFQEILSGAAQCVAKLPALDVQVLKNIWQHVVSRRRNEYFTCVYSSQIEHSSKVSSLKVVGETASPTAYGGGSSCSNSTTFIDTRSFVPRGIPNYSNPTNFMKTRSYTAYGGGSSSNPTTFMESENYDPNNASKGGQICSNPKVNECSDHDHQGVSKKRRFIWTDEYHQIFLDAINDITTKVGKIVPAKIMKYMKTKGVSHISRENIASHLQKYRSYMKKCKNGIDKPSDFPNNDVTKESNLVKSCPSDDQTLTKTQNLTKQEQETSFNEAILFDKTMHDTDWERLEGLIIPRGFENNSTISPNMFDGSMEISDQPQQVGQESNKNYSSLEELGPSIESANQIFDTNGNIIISPHDHPLMTDFNQGLNNGVLNEHVYNPQNFDSFESFENLIPEDSFQAFRG